MTPFTTVAPPLPRLAGFSGFVPKYLSKSASGQRHKSSKRQCGGAVCLECPVVNGKRDDLKQAQSSLWPQRSFFGLLQLAGAVARAREQPSQTRRECLEPIAVCVKPMTTRCEVCGCRRVSAGETTQSVACTLPASLCISDTQFRHIPQRGDHAIACGAGCALERRREATRCRSLSAGVC